MVAIFDFCCRLAYRETTLNFLYRSTPWSPRLPPLSVRPPGYSSASKKATRNQATPGRPTLSTSVFPPNFSTRSMLQDHYGLRPHPSAFLIISEPVNGAAGFRPEG